MAGATKKEESRVLMEDLLDPWSSFAGWWIVGAPLKIHCIECPDVKQVEAGKHVWVSVRPGRALCAEHAAPEIAKLAEAEADAQKRIASAPDPLREREVLSRERLAAAVERFTTAFEVMSSAMTRYVRHLTKRQ